MLKTSTQIGDISRMIGEEKAVAAVAAAGFDAWDFSMFRMVNYHWSTRRLMPCDHPLAGRDYLSFARRLRHIGEECGIVCNQSHAPFPSDADGMFDRLKRSLECTAEAGGTICVIHPVNTWSPEKNAELYAELLPFAKGCGVKIATENMWNWDAEKEEALPAACSDPASFAAHLDAVGDPDFVACLDIGHAEMRGLHTTAQEMILALGDRLQALHIHDNDHRHDSHNAPFSMQIDFGRVAAALRKIGYRGYLTLEADRYFSLNGIGADGIPAGLSALRASVGRLGRMIEEAEP